jgi:hypothetical protein
MGMDLASREKPEAPLSKKPPAFDAVYYRRRLPFKRWIELAKKHEDDPEATLYCQRQAYFNSSNLGESFYQFVADVITRGMDPNQLDPGPHRRACRFAARNTDLDDKKFPPDKGDGRRKLYYASRGTFKSTIVATAYAVWRIGREYLLTGESRIRIAFCSEKQEMAQRNLEGVRQALELNPEIIRLMGNHRPERTGLSADDFSRVWSRGALKSRYRIEPLLIEPTVGWISIKATRTGFHYDILICDDVQAETVSYSLDQVESCWRFFELLDKILVQDGSGEKLVLGTRWGNDDIFARIKAQNLDLPQERQYDMLVIPARSGDPKTGKINFPTIFTSGYLEAEYTKNKRMYMNQMMLESIADEDMEFKLEYLRDRKASPDRIAEIARGRVNLITAVDFAFTEQAKYVAYGSKAPDYTVVLTCAIDADWNYYVIEWFRERCTKTAAMRELYRQWQGHERRGKFAQRSRRVIIQRFDTAQMEDALFQYGRQVGFQLPIDWITYPSKMNKDARIETALEPLFSQKKIWIPEDWEWFITEEYETFPESKKKDTLETLANIMWGSNPGLADLEVHKITPNELRIQKLQAAKAHIGARNL